MQKQKSKLCGPVQFYLIFLLFFINFVHKCLVNDVLRVICPSPLQTSIFWPLLYLQSFSQTFNLNIKLAHCRKVLNWTVFCNTIVRVWFRSKSVIRKLSILVGGVFPVEPSFPSKILIFLETWIIIEEVESKRKVFRQSQA